MASFSTTESSEFEDPREKEPKDKDSRRQNSRGSSKTNRRVVNKAETRRKSDIRLENESPRESESPLSPKKIDDSLEHSLSGGNFLSPSLSISHTKHHHKFSEVIELNVGGTYFTTTLTTLRKYPKSTLGKMFSGKEPVIRDSAGRYFIDRDPVAFRVILDFLRTAKVVVPPNVSMPVLLEECYYYCIEGFDLAVTVNTNVAEQFRLTNYKVVRPSFDKLWPVLQKRLKLILENEPAFAAEIEWAPRVGTHNTLYKVEAAYDGDWVLSKCYIKVEISWKEEGTLRSCACVESWSKFLSEYGFRMQVVDASRLRLFW